MPWLVWLSGLSASLRTKGSPLRFPVRAHAWVAGQVPSGGCMRGNHTLMFLSLSFPFPSPSLKINKWNLYKNSLVIAYCLGLHIFSSFRYLLISVNPTQYTNMISCIRREHISWLSGKLCGWLLEELHSKQLYSETFYLEVWTFCLQLAVIWTFFPISCSL